MVLSQSKLGTLDRSVASVGSNIFTTRPKQIFYMHRSIFSSRKPWTMLIGLFVATYCAVGLWSSATVAQAPPAETNAPVNVCATGLVQPSITNKSSFPVYQVIKDAGVARLGPDDDCARITPLPKGTKARVIATAEGPNRVRQTVPWSQLDYGAWIESSELTLVNTPALVNSQITSISTRALAEATEIVFPLSSAVPIQVAQADRLFSLTLHNTSCTIQTLTENNKVQKWASTVKFTNPVVDRATWQKVGTDAIRFNFQLKPKQQWGYRLRYEGNSLVLALRQPPKITSNISQPLRGVKIVVDPGHGKEDSGALGTAKGLTYMEKTLNLQLSIQLQQELQKRGAIVTMTRSTDLNPSLDDRQVIINQVAPALSISIHHNASDRVTANGTSIYWYQPQSQSLAASVLNYFAREGKRPILNNNGVIEKSFAVARPTGAPAVLLEVGFMTSPEEVFELAQPATQQRLAKVLASGIQQWVIDRAIS
jgi:N-acetylmuramoyl-L-alanine amidase